MAKKSKKGVKSKSEEIEVYADEEQGILKDEDSEEIEADMREGKKTEDVYSDEGLEVMEEEDEIEPWEEGFMKGAKDAGQLGKDALTGEPLMNAENVVETEIKGKIYRFVNEKNAKAFRKKMREKKED